MQPSFSASQSTPMDLVTEGLIHVEDVFNVNSMQIIVADVRLSVERLRRVLRVVLPRFPLLLCLPDEPRTMILRAFWRPDDIPVEERQFAGPFSFTNATFRHVLSDWNTERPLRWRSMPPVRFGIFRASSPEGPSALVMCVHHAVADAKADSMLLGEIMSKYHAAAVSKTSSKTASRAHEFTCLPPKVPEGSRLLRRVTIALNAMVDAVRCMGHRDVGYPPRQGVDLSQLRAIDFYHSLIPVQTQRRLLALSKDSGYSVNSIVAAAIVRMQVRRSPRVSASRMVRLIAPVSLRRRLGPAYASEYRNFMVPCVVRVRNKVDDRQLLEEVTRRFDAIKADRVFVELWKQRVLILLLRQPFLRRLLLRWIYAGYGSGVVYSNPGIVEESFRHFGLPSRRITDYMGVGCMPPPAQMIIYTPTIDGRLHLNGVFLRSAFQDFEAQVIQPVREELERLAGKGLRTMSRAS